MNFFSYERQVCDSESYHIPAFILLYEKIIDKFSFWGRIWYEKWKYI